jgi:glyoxylate/hydroxypyruvate reductase
VLERCVVLPHVATATFEARLGMASLAVKNLLACIDDEDMPASLDLKVYG